GLAGGARSERVGHHRPVQRTVARTTAVERVSHRATLGDRGLGDGAGRPDPLPLLTLSGRAQERAPASTPRSASFTVINRPGAVWTAVFGINNRGQVVGVGPTAEDLAGN